MLKIKFGMSCKTWLASSHSSLVSHKRGKKTWLAIHRAGFNYWACKTSDRCRNLIEMVYFPILPS